MFQVVILSVEIHCEANNPRQGIEQAKETFKDRIDSYGTDYAIGLMDCKVIRSYESQADIVGTEAYDLAHGEY